MDIIGLGDLGFETTKIDEWRTYGPEVMGFQIGSTPAADLQSLYFKTDDRRHRRWQRPRTHRAQPDFPRARLHVTRARPASPCV